MQHRKPGRDVIAEPYPCGFEPKHRKPTEVVRIAALRPGDVLTVNGRITAIQADGTGRTLHWADVEPMHNLPYDSLTERVVPRYV